MSDKPFDAEACDIGGQASATNGLSDIKTHIENAPCNPPQKKKKSENTALAKKTYSILSKNI
jgi:hypothetical protein